MSNGNRLLFLIMGILTTAPVYLVWGQKVGTVAIVPWFIAYRVADTICDAIKEKGKNPND